MRWAQEQRLNFIAERLVLDGFINRSDLVCKFRISTPQASIDIREFKRQHPDAIVYDASLKRYVVAVDTHPTGAHTKQESHE